MASSNRLPVAIVLTVRRRGVTTNQVFPGLLTEAEAEALDLDLVAEGATPGESIILAVDPPLDGGYFARVVMDEVRSLRAQGYEIVRLESEEDEFESESEQDDDTVYDADGFNAPAID